LRDDYGGHGESTRAPVARSAAVLRIEEAARFKAWVIAFAGLK
jgi:hypothetical protein